MSWRLLGQYNGREHWTIYLLATASNLFLSIPLYIAARAAIVALLPVGGSTYEFITAYGRTWGIVLDFLWTLLVFQGILAVLTVTIAGSALIEKGWRAAYIFSGLVMSGFVGVWLAARFVQALSWVSLLESAGINGSGVYADLFWFGLGATIFFVAMILVLRKSYDKIREQKSAYELTARRVLASADLNQDSDHVFVRFGILEMGHGNAESSLSKSLVVRFQPTTAAFSFTCCLSLAFGIVTTLSFRRTQLSAT